MAISKNCIIGYHMSTKHGNAGDFTNFVNNLKLQNKVLLLDNVAFHKTKAFKDAMNVCNNRLLYTPPYSPQFNPIELAFSKIKCSYRKLNYTNNNSLEENIKQSIQTIRITDLHNYYRHVATIVQKKIECFE
jgi:transposase